MNARVQANIKAPCFTPLATGLVQWACACGKHTGSGGECAECQAKRAGTLQRAARQPGPVGGVPPIVHDVLRAPGQPLDAATRAFMEPRFGHDFSQVRVHTDRRAAESARAVDALAYTVGRDVVFGTGQYAPGTAAGQHLLAHELTHTIQQGGMAGGASHQDLRIGPTGDHHEQEAQQVARAAVAAPLLPAPFQVTTAARSIQRQAPAPAPAPTAPVAPTARAGFTGCAPALESELQSLLTPALTHVDGAITALSRGWRNMDPTAQSFFRQYFDPANSGDIDDGFVRDVRIRYGSIRQYMRNVTFNCDPNSWTICGTNAKWCQGGRLMWTCFGDLHVCPAFAASSNTHHKIATIIHESTHNALMTTDREYTNSPDFSRLRPRGSGILSFLSQIPVLGFFFRLLRSNNDTLNNPDSYAEFAMEM